MSAVRPPVPDPVLDPVLPIVTGADAAVLRAVAAPVTAFDGGLASLARSMLATMYDAPGRGLAAPQVGQSVRLIVMDPTWKDGMPDPVVMANPAVAEASGTFVAREEGCLSLPGEPRVVARPDRVRVAWQGLDGSLFTAWFDGFAAACVQHEIDHLDGVLIVDVGEPSVA